MCPAYGTGDVLMWLRETLHAGPVGNTTTRQQARLYLGGITAPAACSVAATEEKAQRSVF